MSGAYLPRGAEAELGSSNIFADLDLPDADKLDLISGLLIEILKVVRRRGLSLSHVAAALDLVESDAQALFAGDFSLATDRQLMQCLNRLGCDIELVVRPSANPIGAIRLA